MTIKDKIKDYFDGTVEVTPLEQAKHDALVRKVRIRSNARLYYLIKKIKKHRGDLS